MHDKVDEVESARTLRVARAGAPERRQSNLQVSAMPLELA